MRILLVGLFVIVCNFVQAQNIEVTAPSLYIANVETEIKFKGSTNNETVTVNGIEHNLEFTNNEAVIKFTPNANSTELIITGNNLNFKQSFSVMPLWLAILPPIIAIVLALLFKEVLTSLFIGIVFGASTIGYYSGGTEAIFTSFFTVVDTYILNALLNWGHIAVIIFSMLIGALVAVISKNGGMNAVVKRISVHANTPVKGQFATWLMGILIFFDDYANTLVVGNTFRPVTDKLKVSREKLAYIVDSTAAPIAAIAFVSTWIGAELGYISDSMANLQNFPAGETAYSIFIGSLKYSFYPVLALLFILIVIFQKKDFGPMLKYEQSARAGNSLNSEITKSDNEFKAKQGLVSKSYLAVVPIITVVLVTLFGLIVTGYDASLLTSETSIFNKLSIIIGNSDSYLALMWASLSALIIAILLSVITKKLSLQESMESSVSGVKAMVPAILILVLAWSLANITEVMHTADFLTQLIGTNINPVWLPAIAFITSAIVSFATGSSWGCMAILYPIALPAIWSLGIDYGLETNEAFQIFLNATACVLAGSVLGDHCSPISDTTILSSLASQCNHITHVKSQMPYALTVGFVSLMGGTLLSAFGVPYIILLPACLVVLWFIVKKVGTEIV